MFLFDEIFLKLFNLSVTASWLILAVLALRFLLKKAPKWINCALWLLVAVRLICPFSFESVLSLVPSTETITEQNFYYSSTPTISSGVETFNSVVNPIISESLAPDPSASVNPTQILGFALGVVWLLGALLMLLYAVISYIKLRKNISTAIPLNENQWICDEVKSPFILGVFRPRIYLPSDLTEDTLKHVIAHEKAHLKRKDHLWKPIGFILLSVYWFNPLMWLSYILLCRDIELACDEKVIKQMEGTDKKAYSEALLSCSAPQRMITVCPVAFGEVGVKQRIKSVLNYKKPAFWVILIAVVASVVVAVCFMTDPLDKNVGGKDMYTWGVDEIDEDNFKMNEIMADVHTYTVKKGDNAYFDATAGNGLGDVSVFLDSLMLGKTTNKNVDYSLVDGCIVANSEKYGKVEIYFAENYSRLWLRSLSDTSESFVYVVLSVEKARDFFNDEEYTDSDTVWEYNPSMSSYGHGTLQIIIDADYESFEAKCEYGEFQFISYDGMGIVHSDGFGKSVVCTENDNLVWRPDNERMQNSNGEEIRIKVNLKSGKTEEFRILLERVGNNSPVSTYFKVSAGNVPVYKDSVGAFRFYLSEKLTWLYNPYAGATWWYITSFSLPEGYSIQSAECTDGEASVEDKYYSEPEGEKCVHWSPDSVNADMMTFADLTVHVLYNGEKVDFTVRIKRLGEEMGTVFSIEPLNCKITEEGLAQYILEPLEEENPNKISSQTNTNIEKEDGYIWYYNPTSYEANADCVSLFFPSQYKILSAETTQGNTIVTGFDERYVEWVPTYANNYEFATDAEVVVHAAEGETQVDFYLKIKKTGNQSNSKIEYNVKPVDCLVIEYDTGRYKLFKKMPDAVYNTQDMLVEINEEYGDLVDFGYLENRHFTFDNYNYYILTPVLSKGTQGDFEYTVHQNGNVQLTKYNGSSTDVIIPDTIEGKPVTYLGSELFYESNIKSVEFGKNVTVVGDYAFYCCDQLEKVKFSQSLNIICYNSFSWTEKLYEVSFPSSLKIIGFDAFSDGGLTKLLIPSNVEYIGEAAFAGNYNLKELVIEDGVNNIKSAAFNNTAIEYVYIPSSATEIEYSVFANCEKLRKVEYASVMEKDIEIRADMFIRCYSLREITLPTNVTRIGEYAFAGCYRLKEIHIPESVVSLGNFVFSECIAISDFYFESANCGGLDEASIHGGFGRIHAPAGGNIEEFCNKHLLLKFVEVKSL